MKKVGAKCYATQTRVAFDWHAFVLLLCAGAHTHSQAGRNAAASAPGVSQSARTLNPKPWSIYRA